MIGHLPPSKGTAQCNDIKGPRVSGWEIKEMKRHRGCNRKSERIEGRE